MSHLPINYLTVALASTLLAAACSQLPPERFQTPEFEEITIDDSEPAAVLFICKMSSMAQLTEYGLDYTDNLDSGEDGWLRINGNQTGNNCFEVTLRDLAPGTTYQYRIFIGNGHDVRQSSVNYYTTHI